MVVKTGVQSYVCMYICMYVYYKTGDQDQVLSATKLQIPLWAVSTT